MDYYENISSDVKASKQYINHKQHDNENRKNNKKILSYCGLYLSLTTAAIFIVQLIIENVAGRFFIRFYESDWFELTLTAIGMLGVGLPLYYILMKKLPDSDRGEVKKLSLGKFIGYFAVSAAAMYLSNIVGLGINFFIEVIKGAEVVNPLEEVISSSNLLIRILYASILGPIVEELIFRKILLDKLRRFGDLPAILVTSIAFGLFHMNLSQLFYATTIGVILAYITLKTNTVRYAILIHMMLNFIGAVISVFAINSGSMVFLALLSFCIYALMIIGTVLFLTNYKKIHLNKVYIPLVKKRDYILNLGTIIFIIICIIMIVIRVIY